MNKLSLEQIKEFVVNIGEEYLNMTSAQIIDKMREYTDTDNLMYYEDFVVVSLGDDEDYLFRNDYYAVEMDWDNSLVASFSDEVDGLISCINGIVSGFDKIADLFKNRGMTDALHIGLTEAHNIFDPETYKVWYKYIRACDVVAEDALFTKSRCKERARRYVCTKMLSAPDIICKNERLSFTMNFIISIFAKSARLLGSESY